MHPQSSDFVARIKMACTQLHLSQEDFTKELGIRDIVSPLEIAEVLQPTQGLAA